MAETLDELLARTFKTALRESLDDLRPAIASAVKDAGIGTDQPSPTYVTVNRSPPRDPPLDADIESTCEVSLKNQREVLLGVAAGPDEGSAVRQAKVSWRLAS